MAGRIHVILVHGTVLFPWQRKSVRQWTTPASPLSQSLAKSLGERATFESFHWSGRNSFAVRAAESRKLAARIIGSPSDAAVFVVAHSHAGNVSLLACHNAMARNRLAGIACLSTPFLHVRDREVSESNIFVALMGMGLAIMVGALLIAGRWHNDAWVLSNYPPVWLVALIGGLCVSIVMLIVEHSSSMSYKHRLPELDRFPLLIMRCTGDEASGSLGFATTLSTYLSRTWQRVANRPWPFRDESPSNPPNRTIRVLSCAWILTLCAWGGTVILDAMEPDRIPPWLVYTLGSIALAPFFLFFLPIWWWQASALFGIVISPPLAIALLFAAVPFGGWPGLRSLKTEIMAEPTPLGRWLVETFPSDAGTDDDASPMYHSQSYSNWRCLERLNQWIAETASTAGSANANRD